VAPPEFALHVVDEGAVEPLTAAHGLVVAAKDLGAKVITHTPVRSLDLCAGRIRGVDTDIGRLDADWVVLAAGVETAALSATAGVALPLNASPALLVVTKPCGKLLNGLVMAPEIHLRQTVEGRLVASTDFEESNRGEEWSFSCAPSLRRVGHAIIAPNTKHFGELAMNRAAKILIAAGAALMLAGTAQAGVTLNAGRVGAEDVAALAKFYESAFGLQEVNRLEFPGMLEIMMNFGDTVAAARTNPNAQIVIMHRDSNSIKDPVPHLILNVTDIAATSAAVKAAGGSMDGEPRAFGKSGMMIGIAVDPAGNRVELIQQPKR